MSCQINNNSNYDVSEIEDLIQDLYSFSSRKMGFKRPPVLNLVSDDQNTSPLGKTAYYDPTTMEITIYVDGRHPKDIMRSFAHELVHHNQNQNGMFDGIQGESGDGYAQSDPHLRKMEKEAYLKGNMCFRDWEDGYKSSNPNILNERRIYKMSINDWKNKELNGLLNEKWGFSMNLNKLNESKPDFADIDGDGDKEESMKDAAKDKEESSDDKPKKKSKKGEIPQGLKDYQNKQKGNKEDSDEKVDEIRMRAGGLGKTPKEETDSAKKASPFTKKQDKPAKVKLKEEESDIEEIKSMLMQNLTNSESEDAEVKKHIETLANMIKSKREKNNPPPKSGGNNSGSPAQPTMQEKKLREAIKKIIKNKLKK
jgi:hypothetical protein